jgi:serine/threonine-protein kinase
VSANGGKPEVLVKGTNSETLTAPSILPGGAVLFTVGPSSGASSGWDKAQIAVQPPGSKQRKVLVDGGSDARYLPSGHLVYALSGSLFAVPFDLKHLQVTGGPVPVIEGVKRTGATGLAQFDFSRNGSLVYVPGPVVATSLQNTLALIGRDGVVAPLNTPLGMYGHPRVSADGKRIAFETDDNQEANIWIYELSGAAAMRRLTFGGANRFAVWTPDGQRVAYQSGREGDLAIYWQAADGTGAAERLTKPEQGVAHIPDSWSPDGQTLSFTAQKGSAAAVWILSLRTRKAAPFAEAGSAFLGRSVFSPDGHWLAYQSNETKRNEIFVQPFPATGAKYQVSRDGDNHHPMWSPDGKELYYSPGPGSKYSVAAITTRPAFTVGVPSDVPKAFTEQGPAFPRNNDILPDGKRYIGVVSSTSPNQLAGDDIAVVLGWFEELKQRLNGR